MSSQTEIYQKLISRGATPEEARILSAIAMAESGGNLGALNDTNIETSAGWFQINTDVHPLSIQQAMNPDIATDYALKLYREQGGRPWSVFQNGAYQQYLGGGDVPMGDPVNPGPNPDGSAGWKPPPPENIKVIPGPNGIPLAYILYDGPTTDPNSEVLTTLTPEQYNNLVTYGTPDGPPGGDTSSSTSTSFSTSQYIPNLVDKFRAYIEGLNALVTAGGIAHDDAVDIAQLEADKVRNKILAAQTVGGFQQTQDTQKIQLAGLQAEDERTRQIARADRALGIQQEFGRRASDLTSNILPFSLAGNVGNLNIPLIGQVFPQGLPTTQVNPNQLYDIAGLNAIPEIPGGFSGQWPTLSAVPSVPVVPPVPEIPKSQVPPIDFSGLMGALNSLMVA